MTCLVNEIKDLIRLKLFSLHLSPPPAVRQAEGGEKI